MSNDRSAQADMRTWATWACGSLRSVGADVNDRCIDHEIVPGLITPRADERARYEHNAITHVVANR